MAKILITLLVGWTAAVTCAEPLVDSILARYGWESFPKAKEIAFTFHGGKFGLGISHAWIYKPQSDSVVCVDKGIAYSRRAIPASARGIDKSFVNDWYWLSFPFHLALDKDIKIEADSVPTESPIGKRSLRRVKVAYPRGAGYTPGDMYELWVAPDGTIEEWKYHRHGGRGGMKWTWEKPETRGGLTFTTEHKGAFNIRFTGISVR